MLSKPNAVVANSYVAGDNTNGPQLSFALVAPTPIGNCLDKGNDFFV
jgi:hypothetical protein